LERNTDLNKDIECLIWLKPGISVVLSKSGTLILSLTLSTIKTVRKRPLGKPRRRWEKNNKMDPKHVGWEDVDSSGSG
jgi:hypothetical protein